MMDVEFQVTYESPSMEEIFWDAKARLMRDVEGVAFDADCRDRGDPGLTSSRALRLPKADEALFYQGLHRLVFKGTVTLEPLPVEGGGGLLEEDIGDTVSPDATQKGDA
jgi:hypothetical protein